MGGIPNDEIISVPASNAAAQKAKGDAVAKARAAAEAAATANEKQDQVARVAAESFGLIVGRKLDCVDLSRETILYCAFFYIWLI